MKIEFKKKLPIVIAIIIAALFTMVFAMLSIINSNSFVLRILMQVSISLTMLFSGVNSFVYLKQRALGFFQWFVSGFTIFVMVLTIIKWVGI